METNTQQQDKRDIILQFCSNPDAVLNALHQAGWKVIQKTVEPHHSDQPYNSEHPEDAYCMAEKWEAQRSEQQEEWTPERLQKYVNIHTTNLFRLAQDINAALAAEREARKLLVEALRHAEMALVGVYPAAGALQECQDALAKVKE